MKVDKRAIRQRIIAQRRALSPLATAAAGAAVFSALHSLAVYRSAAAVVAYVAHDSEVSTDQVLRDVKRSGRPLYLPITKGALGFRLWESAASWINGLGGVPEISGEAQPLPAVASVVLLPLVAWSEQGDRLGRGGGFYDRMLGMRSAQAVLIGLAYEFQKVAAMPRDPWDVGLDYVVTERRVIRCGAPAALHHLSEEGATKHDGLHDPDRGLGVGGNSRRALRGASASPDPPAERQCRGDGAEDLG
jgi:5-formyltetrahydrofolate cyclo-ligase